MPTGQALLAQMQSVSVMPNSLAIWGMGQMGLAVKGPEGMLYIDPCLSDVVRDVAGDWWTRGYEPPLQPQDLRNADFILCSHEHLDHLDPQTVGPAAKAAPNARFVVTGWSREIMADAGVGEERLIVPTALEPMTLPGTSARLTAVPSAHYNVEYDETKGHRWLGFVIEWNGVTLYHSGDTIIYDGYIDTLKGLPPIDIAMLAVNGRDWYREADVGAIGNLWPNEAARLAKDMGWGMLFVGHNDLFPNNAIPWAAIAEAFANIAPRQPYKLMQPGELYYAAK